MVHRLQDCSGAVQGNHWQEHHWSSAPGSYPCALLQADQDRHEMLPLSSDMLANQVHGYTCFSA
eukprot:4631035-Karenia_brevis.AAC.2